MTTTAARRISALTDLLLDALERGDELPVPGLCEALATLTGAEIVSWHEVDWSTGGSRSVVWPDPGLAGRAERLLREHRAVHPLVRHYATTADLTVLTAAEVCGGDAVWQQSLACHLLRSGFGVDQQMGLPVSVRMPVLRSFALSRSGRDFDASERERAVAALRAVRLIDAHLAEARPCTTTVPRQFDRSGGSLTPREAQALAAMRGGALRRTAARRLGIAPRTLDKHLEHAYAKLGVGDLLSALNVAEALDPVRTGTSSRPR